MSSRDPGCECK